MIKTLEYEVVLTFRSVDKTLECDHSSESYFLSLNETLVFDGYDHLNEGIV